MGQKERVLSLEHDGQVYNLTPRDFTALDDLEVHRVTRHTIADIFFHSRVTLFTMAALVWRYRVNEGEPDLTYLEVARTFTFDSIETVTDGPQETSRPEA